ncbi:MFS transporter [Streptomyces nogalater]
MPRARTGRRSGDQERRRALVGVVGGILLANSGSYIWFPVLVATLGGSDSGFWAGVVMCMTYVGRLLATFCYEGIAARSGIRTAVFLGTALEAVALGLMGFADGVLVYSVLAFFIGFGSGTSFPGLKNVLVSFPEDERPKAFSAFQMAGQVGLFGGALLGAVLADVELRTLFTVVFVFFAGFCLITSALLPGTAPRGRRTPRAGASRCSAWPRSRASRYAAPPATSCCPPRSGPCPWASWSASRCTWRSTSRGGPRPRRSGSPA